MSILLSPVPRCVDWSAQFPERSSAGGDQCCTQTRGDFGRWEEERGESEKGRRKG